MKIKELKRIAKENDYILSRHFGDFTFTEGVGENYINISGDYKNRIWFSNPSFCNEKDFNMIKAAVEFAETPLEEREEPKKYHLRHKWMKEEDYNYLSLDLDDNYYYLDDIEGFDWSENKFTREEIEDIKEKYDTKLEDFEIVEVEE
jgi:hypothetical protein|nr:MAG TPA: hypothetical protein [Caudoviricetes sp.]